MNIIIASLILAFISLVSVSIVNSRQTRKRLISQRLSQLKRKVGEMEELAVALENLTGSVAIERIVLEEVIDTLNGMKQLSEESQTLDLNLQNAIQRAQEISGPAYSCSLYRIMESDATIARAQYHLSEAGRILRKRQAGGRIELAEMNTYIVELAWAHLMVSVISMIGQGHKAVRRGDVLRGFSFYKKAQEAAMASPISDDRRHQIIKELGDILANRRKSISIQLMPETDLNPDLAPPSQNPLTTTPTPSQNPATPPDA